MKLPDVINPGRILFRDHTYSPDEVRKNIDDFSRHLTKVLPPDRPFIYLTGVNHPKFIFAYFAIIKSGRIAVIVEPKVGRIEWGEMLEKVPPSAVIRIDSVTLDWNLETEIDLLENGAEYTDELDDVCTMIFHAADDGYAKALMLTNINLYSDATASSMAYGTSLSSLICTLSPFCHLYSITVGILAPLLAGCDLKVFPMDQSESLEKVLLQKPTHIIGVPVSFYLLLKNKIHSHLFLENAILICGAYKLSTTLWKRFKMETGLEIKEGYGLSEASPVCTWNHPAMALDPQLVGTPLQCCRLRILSKEGTEEETDKEGEIFVAGENVFKGYYQDSYATSAILCQGWLRTRDTGKIDKWGRLCLTGNTRRMLNSMGKKVFPAEIERIISRHTNVDQIEVYGSWNELSGHSVKGRVHLKQPGQDALNELRDWCKKSITSYKIPKLSEM